MGVLLAALIALLALPSAARAGPPPAACPQPQTADRLQGVTPEGDLVLEATGLAKVAGLRWPEEASGREGWLGRVRALIGQPVRVAAAEGLDRWGRRAVHLAASEGPGAAGLSSDLIGQGGAIVSPQDVEEPCWRFLLSLEAEARAAGLGLWATDLYRSVPATEIARLNERVGRFAIVQGRVQSIGERVNWTYLNFSRDWATDFTIMIPQRVWAKSFSVASLQKRMVRVRGMLESRGGPALTVTHPGVIEIVDEGRGR